MVVTTIPTIESKIRRDFWSPLEQPVGEGGLQFTIFDGLDAAVDGYFVALVENLPSVVLRDLGINEEDRNLHFFGDLSFEILGQVQSVSLPNVVVEKVKWTGNSYFRWFYPQRIEYDETFSLTFYDYVLYHGQTVTKSNILNILSSWVRAIPSVTGSPIANPVPGRMPLGFTNVLILLCTPTLEPIFPIFFTNVFPTSLPLSNLNISLESVQIRTVQCEFSFNQLYYGSHLMEKLEAESWWGTLKDLLKQITKIYKVSYS